MNKFGIGGLVFAALAALLLFLDIDATGGWFLCLAWFTVARKFDPWPFGEKS